MLDDKLTAVIGMQVNKGSKLHFVVTSGDGGLPAGVAWSLGYQEEVDAIMAQHLAELGDHARCLRRWPDFTLLYFPGPDDVAHFKGARSREYRSALRSLDCSLGRMLRALDEGGILEPMTLVLTSDHGIHDVAPQNHVDLARYLGTAAGIAAYGGEDDVDEDATYLDNANDASLNRRINRFRPWPVVVTHSGERHASLHLRVSDDWSVRPTAEQTLRFHLATRPSGDAQESFPAVLLRHPGIEHAVVRDGTDAVEIHGRQGIARVERDRSAPEPAYRYAVLSGHDPLFHDEPAPATADGAFHGSRAWLEATAAMRHPDVVAQIVDAFDDRKAGDLMLFAAPCWDFYPEYSGGHGGIERDEMRIPMYFAGPRIAPGATIPAARLVDVVPTVLDLMGVGERAHLPCCRLDGVSLADRLLAVPAETRLSDATSR
jgi:arylsulfatase A-like enzyme